MIYKDITGRLGNQMFQYAALLAYSKQYHDPNLNLNFDHLGLDTYENNLVDFNVGKYNLTHSTPKPNLIQKILLLRIRVSDKIIRTKYSKDAVKETRAIRRFDEKHAKLLMKHGIYHVIQGYLPLIKSHSKTKFFYGNFESPKFFDQIRPQLLKEFEPKHPPLKKNNQLYKAIASSESVCVTIRRGDWVENAEFHARHYVCTPEYFERSIKQIQTMIKKPRFFVFSDDVDWVKHNMNFPSDTMYESGNDPVWEKLRMMYNCKHFIISNSTFSWWAQYLSRNPNKIVIAPTRWKNHYQNNDIYQPSWTLVDPDNDIKR